MTGAELTTAMGAITTAIQPLIAPAMAAGIGIFALLVGPKKIFGFVKSMVGKA